MFETQYQQHHQLLKLSKSQLSRVVGMEVLDLILWVNNRTDLCKDIKITVVSCSGEPSQT